MSFEIKWAADELTLRDDSSDEPQRVENDDDSIVQPSPRRRWLWGTLVAILIVVGVVTGVVIGSSPPVASSPTSASNEGNDESDPFSVTLSAEEIFLRSVSRKYGVEFDDKTSYQSKALKWVETFESLGFDGKIDEFRVLQRYALACIYYATNNVPNAYTQKNFKDHPLSGWLVETGWLVDDDECEWMGVRCDDEGAVVELNMRNNILSGTFPPEAAYLKSLRLLDLYNNQMYNPGAGK